MIGWILIRRLDEFYSDDWQLFVPMIGKTWINRYFVIQIKPLPQAPQIRGQPPGAFVLTLFSLKVKSLFRRIKKWSAKQRIIIVSV